jgi:tetratricopeptide (TPR) repeat protein
MLTQGEPREALTSLALAADIYRHLGWYSELTKVSLAKALVLIDEDQLDDAEELLVRAALDASTVGVADRVRALTQLALINRRRGALEDGLELAQQAVTAAGDSVVGGGAEALREAGLCAHGLGDVQSAVSMWQRALDAFTEMGDREEAAKTSRLLGDHFTDVGDDRAAAAAYRQGLGAVEQLK